MCDPTPTGALERDIDKLRQQLLEIIVYMLAEQQRAIRLEGKIKRLEELAGTDAETDTTIPSA